MSTTHRRKQPGRRPSPRGALAFEKDAERVVGILRRSFAAVIETALGRVGTAKEVADGFKIHRKLGWQIARVAYDDDPFLAARFVPTARSVQGWLESARDRHVPEALIEDVSKGMDAFQKLIDIHAHDRELLEMMLESCGSRPDEVADQRWRSEAFRGNSYIFGVRVKTQLSMAIVAPSETKAEWFDLARISAQLGFVRTRPNVRWVIGQTVTFAGEDDAVMRPAREALAPGDSARHDGVPLIEQFCSKPIPRIVRRPGPEGLVEDELQSGPVGERGEVDVVMGEVLRELGPVYGTRENENALFGTGVRTPAEMLVCDLFVHRELFQGVERTLRVFGEMFSPVTQDDRDQIVVADTVHHLGRGINRLSTPEVPHYASLANFTFDRCGWSPSEFDLYRVLMPYPPAPTSVMIHHRLPRSPTGS